MNTLLAILTILAVWRMTRLVTVDYLTDPFRHWVARRSGPEGKLTYLVECPWCFSVWLAPPIVFAAVWWPDNRAVWIAMLAGAASAMSGLLSGFEDRMDR